MAAKLNAECCYDFSGQVSLAGVDKQFYIERFGDAIENNPYYNLSDLIRNSDCSFYYFYPYHNQEDRESFHSIMSAGNNVYGFGFNHAEHAQTMLGTNMGFIISQSITFMNHLYCHYQDRIISPISFFFRTVPISKWALLLREAKSFIKRFRAKHKNII